MTQQPAPFFRDSSENTEKIEKHNTRFIHRIGINMVPVWETFWAIHIEWHILKWNGNIWSRYRKLLRTISVYDLKETNQMSSTLPTGTLNHFSFRSFRHSFAVVSTPIFGTEGTFYTVSQALNLILISFHDFTLFTLHHFRKNRTQFSNISRMDSMEAAFYKIEVLQFLIISSSYLSRISDRPHNLIISMPRWLP